MTHMTIPRFILRNLAYFRAPAVAVVAGMAVATAALAGALMVGDSVRGSLRELAVQRLGQTDYALVGTRFFQDSLGEPGRKCAGAEWRVRHRPRRQRQRRRVRRRRRGQAPRGGRADPRARRQLGAGGRGRVRPQRGDGGRAEPRAGQGAGRLRLPLDGGRPARGDGRAARRRGGRGVAAGGPGRVRRPRPRDAVTVQPRRRPADAAKRVGEPEGTAGRGRAERAGERAARARQAAGGFGRSRHREGASPGRGLRGGTERGD